MRRIIPFVAAVLLLGSVAQHVRAQEPDADAKKRAKELFQLADTEYRLGRFESALKDYQEALKLRHHTAIIFNIAQCHRQLKNHERARFFYKLFLADWERLNPGTTPPNEGEVKQLITEMETALRAEEQRRRDATARTGGELVLKGVPGGAQVFVDGVLRGAGPILAPIGVPPGKHLVRVEKPGFEAFPGEVVVALNKPATLEVQLRKLVNVGIGSHPEGAAIAVDGEERGWTPVRVTLAAERPHTVVLRKSGYLPLQQSLTLEPQETAVASYNLEPSRDLFGTRNELFAFETGMVFGMGGPQTFAAGGATLIFGTIKWKHVCWSPFAMGGGSGGPGRFYVQMETRLAYPFRFGNRGQHQLLVGTGFGVFTFYAPDDPTFVKEKCASGCGDAPQVGLGLSPAVEYVYQTSGRTLFGGGFRILAPFNRGFTNSPTVIPAAGQLSFRLGWASAL
jgi:hypothetical protein